jgi:hypothetical protein
VTPQRLRIYAKDLAADLTREQVQTAMVRARRELKWFPKISELREMAGVKAEDLRKVEAEAAWDYANKYLRKFGVDLLPTFCNGKLCDPPNRIDYALRRIGGLRGLNQITEQSRPFVFKDFCEAYQQSPMAEMLAPQLSGLFNQMRLKAKSMELAGNVEEGQ